MANALETLQEIPANHELRSAVEMAHALTDMVINHHDGNQNLNPNKQAYRGNNNATKLGLDSTVKGVEVRGTGNDQVLLNNEKGKISIYNCSKDDGFLIQVRDNPNGTASVSVKCNSKNPSAQVDILAREVLGAMGVENSTIDSMLKDAKTYSMNAGEIKKSLSKTSMEENIADHMGERKFPVHYKTKVENVLKAQQPVVEPQLSSPVAEAEVQKPLIVESEFLTKTTSLKADGTPDTTSIASKPGAIPEYMLSGLKTAIEEKGLTCEVKDGSLIVSGLSDQRMIDSLERNINSTGQKTKEALAQAAPAPQKPDVVADMVAKTAELAGKHGEPTPSNPDTPRMPNLVAKPRALNESQEFGRR
jgi:hypothetical protein